jgi:hypothetical protein
VFLELSNNKMAVKALLELAQQEANNLVAVAAATYMWGQAHNNRVLGRFALYGLAALGWSESFRAQTQEQYNESIHSNKRWSAI